MSEEFEKHLRENILPKTLDLSEFDIWSCDFMSDGIEDFTQAAMQKKFRVRMISRDVRMEITLHLDRK